MNEDIMRGDIFYADLNPVVGSEQGGCRPVLVIQNDKGNYYSKTVIVAVITSNCKSSFPTHAYIANVLRNPSVVRLEQIRALDKSRLKRYVATLSGKQMRVVNKRLMVSLGLDRREVVHLRANA